MDWNGQSYWSDQQRIATGLWLAGFDQELHRPDRRRHNRKLAGKVDRIAERVQRSGKVRSERYARRTVEWLPQCCVRRDCIHRKSLRIWWWRECQFGVWAFGSGIGGQWRLHSI